MGNGSHMSKKQSDRHLPEEVLGLLFIALMPIVTLIAMEIGVLLPFTTYSVVIVALVSFVIVALFILLYWRYGRH